MSRSCMIMLYSFWRSKVALIKLLEIMGGGNAVNDFVGET